MRTVRHAADGEWLARDDAWAAGGDAAPPILLRTDARPATGAVAEVLRGVDAGEEVGYDEIVTLFGARGADADTVAAGQGSVDALVARIVAFARPGDTVAVLSNGAFGGIHHKLADALRDAPEAP